MDTAQFLRTVHGTADGYIVISTLEPTKAGQPKPKPVAYSFAPEKMELAEQFIEQVKDTKHVYVTAAPLKEKPATGRGSEEYVSSVYCLHADIDIYNPEAHSKANLPASVEEARGLLAGLPEPSLLLHTGNGLLALWLLSENVRNLSHGSKLLKGVQAHIKSTAQANGWHVDSTADLARIIRVAGSLNHKTSPAKPVTVLEGIGQRYSPMLFERYVLPEQPKARVKAQGNMSKERAQELLQYIPQQQSYEDWLKVLAALKYELGSEGALELAEAWSPSFEGEVEYKLTTLKDNHANPATGGTLYYLAKQHGYVPSFSFSDLGNGERLALNHGSEVRYLYTEQKWLIWDGKRWAVDTTGEIERKAKATARSIYAEVAAIADDTKREDARRFARYSESGRGRQEMIRAARTEQGIAITPEQLDTEPWLLNCNNGTLDLRTGELYPHNPANLITKLCPVDYMPEAQAPRWLSFLDRIMDGDAELISYLQKAVGYSLTGDTSEQCLFFMYGEGKNGKSTFTEALIHLFGDYQLKAPTSMLMLKKSEGVPNDVAQLARGARFTVAAEIGEGNRLNESLIKDLTGGDTLTARFLHKEFMQFKPTHKLWMYGNHKPLIRGTDKGIWRRIKLIPFTAHIPTAEQDKRLGQKLRAELQGILAWAVQGCLAWQREGLGLPTAVQQATDTYRSEMDSLGSFIEDRCELKEGAVTPKKELYEAYKAWCDLYGEYPLSHKLLSLRLQERGIEEGRTKTTRFWAGIRLNVGLVFAVDGPEVVGREPLPAAKAA